MQEVKFGSLPLAFQPAKEKCEKHNVAFIQSPKLPEPVCPRCESERIQAENQERVDKISKELDEQKRLYFIKELSMYDETLDKATFENFETTNDFDKRALEWAKAKTREWYKGARNNIVLRGRAGTGKSHLAFAMVKALSEGNGKKALFVNVPTLMDKAMDNNFEKKNFYIDQLSSVDYLVLDDLGKEYKSNVGRLMIYSILNARSNTIITTNLTDRELTAHYDNDPAIITRIKKGIPKGSDNQLEFDEASNKRTIYF